MVMKMMKYHNQDTPTAAGYRAAMEGFSMHPPKRKKALREAWEDGWLEGKRDKEEMLAGKDNVIVGSFIAFPCVNRVGEVIWRNEKLGKDFTSPEEAKATLEAVVERLKRLAELSAN